MARTFVSVVVRCNPRTTRDISREAVDGILAVDLEIINLERELGGLQT